MRGSVVGTEWPAGPFLREPPPRNINSKGKPSLKDERPPSQAVSLGAPDLTCRAFAFLNLDLRSQ